MIVRVITSTPHDPLLPCTLGSLVPLPLLCAPVRRARGVCGADPAPDAGDRGLGLHARGLDTARGLECLLARGLVDAVEWGLEDARELAAPLPDPACGACGRCQPTALVAAKGS